MARNFYKLSIWEKVLICIGAFSTLLGGLYYFFHWLDIITNKFFLTSTPSEKIMVGIIFLISGLVLTYFILYANSTFPLIIQLLKKLKTGDQKIIINTKENETNDLINKEYKSELGEIAAYWGNRNAANIRIKDLLKSTTATEIFIAAIGFSTIKVLDDTEVINHFSDLINNNSTLKITIVSPRNKLQIKNARPEISEDVLNQNFEAGQLLLKTFKYKLLAQLTKKNEIDIHIKFKYYNDNTIPRHFILQDYKTIFFGSYLSSETGNNSYLMELCNNTHEPHRKELTGLYNLFLKEIDNIKANSTETNF